MVVTFVLAAQYAAALDLADTSSARLRSTTPAQIIGNDKVILALDLATAASARLSAHDRHAELALSYSPTIFAPDLELLQPIQAQNAVAASVAWHDRFVRFTASESVSYAHLNTAFLYAPAPAAQTAPPPSTGTTTAPGMTGMTGTTGGTASGAPSAMGTAGQAGSTTTGPGTGTGAARPFVPAAAVDVGSSNADGGLAIRAGRHLTVAASGGYSVAGGLTATSRQVVPMQYGPHAQASVTDNLSRIDSFTTSGSFLDTVTYGACPPTTPAANAPTPSTTGFCRERTSMSQLQVAVRRSLTPTETLTVTAGASVAVSRSPLLNELVLEPIAAAALTIRLDDRPSDTLGLSLQLAPVIDPLTGIPSERVQGSVLVGARVTERLLLALSLGALRSLPVVRDPYPITGVSGGVEARFAVTRRIDLGIGEQEFWQSQSPYGSITSSVAYVSFSARAPTLHF